MASLLRESLATGGRKARAEVSDLLDKVAAREPDTARRLRQSLDPLPATARPSGRPQASTTLPDSAGTQSLLGRRLSSRESAASEPKGDKPDTAPPFTPFPSGQESTGTLLRDLRRKIGEAKLKAARERTDNRMHTHHTPPPDPLTETKADLIEWGGRTFGRPQAAAALRHYREGSGDDRRLSPDWLRRHGVIRDAEDDNHARLEIDLGNDPGIRRQLAGLKDGQSVTLRLGASNPEIRAPGRSDLHYTSGKSNLDTDAHLKVTRQGRYFLISGRQDYNWHDDYNWHKDTRFLGGAVTGEEMGHLATRGDAADYTLVSDWSGDVSGIIPVGEDGQPGTPRLWWRPKGRSRKR